MHPMTVGDHCLGGDWLCVLACAEFSACDVKNVLAKVEGEKDELSWVLVVQLSDDNGEARYAAVEAGCDYTGWDCVGNFADTTRGATLPELLAGLPEQTRERLPRMGLSVGNTQADDQS